MESNATLNACQSEGESSPPYYGRVRISVVIVTFNGRERLTRALASLETQTRVPDEVIVVDNASTDGTLEVLSERSSRVIVVKQAENLGFGRAVNAGVAVATGDVLVFINNDVVCEPEFITGITEPLHDSTVGMVAGVLLQEADPARIDTAGLVLDRTLRSWDYLGDCDVEVLDGLETPPLGPCGGAGAYRTEAFRGVGGFDETLFAYWEDVDLAVRLHAAGWRCVIAPTARAIHAHGATTGAMSPRMRELDAFGRGFIVGKYSVMHRGPVTAAATAVLDWPALAVHAVARRELDPLRARRRGVTAGKTRAQKLGAVPAAVDVGTGLKSQWGSTFNRLRGRGPAHFQ